MTILTTILVSEKTRKRAQRVNALFKAEVVSITDLLMQSAFSQG